VSADPFGTAALRAAVLGAWRASPARLREDANTEEDHARGYYRDRVLVDLAQNASDAAVRAGVPGRLLLSLERGEAGWLLVVANTGQPLDGPGVAALASMRASAKRDEAALVGQFGVGFAAVRAVADEIEVRSATGSIGFSLAGTRAALADSPDQLAAEVARRGDWLPVLRLPFVSSAGPLPGYDTAVVAALRDQAAVDRVVDQLDQVGDPLLLALPGLVEIVVQTPDGPPRRIADAGRRWRIRTETGNVELALTADRPVEERGRTHWRITWALPRPGVTVTWPQVLHAPTPTDDPCSLPALLIGTLPLDPTRRHVAAGRLTEALLDRAAAGYAALAAELAAEGGDALALVPTGLAGGGLDGALHAAVVAALAGTALLPSAHGLLEPGRAVALDGPADDELVAALSTWLPALVRVPASGRAAARVLGLPLRRLADLVDELPTVPGPWPELYAACAGVVGPAVEALAGLPVPLADGRVVRGPRGTILLDAELVRRLAPATLTALADWGVRVVDPDAADPVLERLGATRPQAGELLRHPAVRAAVLGRQEDPTDGDLGEVAAAVLDLVACALAEEGADGAGGGDREDGPGWAPVPAWLGLVELPAADGEPTPAHGLVLPGSAAHRLFDDRVLAPVAQELVDRYGPRVLRALGVRATPVPVTVPDVVADPAAVDLDGDDDAALVAQGLDGWSEYLDLLADRLGPGAWVGDLTAVADLDAVADEAWPQLLATLGADRELRAALLDPVRGDRAAVAPSYTAWWLRHRGPLGLDGPFALAGQVLAGLLPSAPAVLNGVDEEVRRALGGLGSAAELDLAGWAAVLDPLAGEPVELATAAQVWRALSALAATGPADGRRPAVLPALVSPQDARLVEADRVTVADAPMWCQRTDLGPLWPAAAGTAGTVAQLLDLPLASELADGELHEEGRAAPVPAAAVAVLGDAPAGWVEHDDLWVDGEPVDWWVDRAGVPHAVHLAGLAAALAQVTGRWHRRWAVEAVLVDPDRLAEVLRDDALSD
jgi:hypothetical protein